jgi:plastocyanin
MKTQRNPLWRLRDIGAAGAVVIGSVLMAAPVLAADTNVNLTASNTFDSATVTVGEGETVTFTWRGGFHDVTFADGVNSGTPVGIDGTTWSRTFDAAGSYAFVCTVHESAGMVGTVTVEAGSAGATATTTTAQASGSATTTAPAAGGASGGSGGSSGVPFTGPEDSMLPLLGAGLAVGGLALRFRFRRTG